MASIFYPRPVPARADPVWQILHLCERGAAAALLLLLSPLLLILGAALAALSGRPPLIAHRRVGQCYSELWVLKFRTMWDSPAAVRFTSSLFAIEYIDDPDGPELKGPRDPRVRNRFASFCRRHSLDELPQLFHVLSGTMSFVGPRPATAKELDQIYGDHAYEIVQAKPGLAGLWQVSGRNRLSLAERRLLDLESIRNRSLRQYLWILMKTVPEVLLGGNSW